MSESESASRKSVGPSAKGSLRGELKRFTRERLIEAAMKSFSEEGFRGTTIEKIVERAGATTPTFYRHFRSKNDLLEPLQQYLEIEVDQVMALLDQLERLDQPNLRKWLDDFVAMWRRMHRLCAAYWEAVELDEALASRSFASSLETARMLKGILGRCPPDARESVELRLALIIPFLDRTVRVANSTPEAEMTERLLDEFAAMLADCFRVVEG